MPYAERDGLRLYYERDGQGELELLFVPGWCCDHTFYAPQFEHFKASHAVTALDPRGCGASDVPEDGYDIPNLADDLARLCEEVGIVKPVVIGHSGGGMVAIELAARHPALPRAVVSDDPGPVHATEEAAAILRAFAAEMAGPSGEDVRRAWVVDGVGPTADDELRRKIVDTMCSVPLQIAAAIIRGVAEWNGAGALALCEVPLLILNPTGRSNDPWRLRPLKPDMQIGATVGAGHFHQLEVPEQVNAMIERFIAIAI
jgi:pimeloyl-ACP methyl ester carboxylesterase